MNTNSHITAQENYEDLVEQLATQLRDGSSEKFPDSSAAAGGAEAPFPPSSDKSGTPSGE